MRYLWVLGDACGTEAKKSQEAFLLKAMGYITEEVS